MNNNLPDLSTWNRVPIGGVIPAFTAYAYASKTALMVELRGRFEDFTVPDSGNTYYTEKPILPPLPTEDGATILASGNDLPPNTLLTLEAGRWVNRLGAEWVVDDIRTWAPVTIGEVVSMP